MNDNILQIEIADQQSRPFDHQKLISVVRTILTDHAIDACELSIAAIDDHEMQAYNKSYLNHDCETDVLSFLLDDDPSRAFLSGQLIVSTDTAARVADEHGIAMQDELLLYVVHGTLHLVGFDDTTPAAAAEMRAAEKKYLSAVGVKHIWPTVAELDEVIE